MIEILSIKCKGQRSNIQFFFTNSYTLFKQIHQITNSKIICSLYNIGYKMYTSMLCCVNLCFCQMVIMARLVTVQLVSVWHNWFTKEISFHYKYIYCNAAKVVYTFDHYHPLKSVKVYHSRTFALHNIQAHQEVCTYQKIYAFIYLVLITTFIFCYMVFFYCNMYIIRSMLGNCIINDYCTSTKADTTVFS